ncbi:hypothetical protein Q8G49_27605, partial [Klebsiella pneumoniae]
MNSEYDLLQSEMSNDLVQVNETEALKIADNLMDTRRYARPWTRDFLQDFSQAYYHGPVAVRAILRVIRETEGMPENEAFALEAKAG